MNDYMTNNIKFLRRARIAKEHKTEISNNID